ncbi:hypothetical protein BDZ94DRAFT_1311345 [Collybia nuda]|uniref:Uncharacterized protein n=1 Tax=Collybia nuda TaxID=64659 RepID=A0A9P5Y3F0_9AGAR|nr:hypothetical protein BDZ94DRAFT_1311345 [Collybia nuda]
MCIKGPIGVAAVLASESPNPIRTALCQFLLINRVAIVTGGHRGLGLEMALALAEAGAIVYCLAQSSSPNEDWLKVQSFAQSLPNLEGGRKGRLEYAKADVANQEELEKVVQEIVDKEGRIDICVANAGILQVHDSLVHPRSDTEKILATNLNGVLFTTQAVGKQMERLGTPGSIILISSIAGHVALRCTPCVAYGASKGAILQMTRSLACELAPKRIRVNSISPGFFETKMIRDYANEKPEYEAQWAGQKPLGRIGRADEIRGVILWLAGDASTFCTGSDVLVDGGYCAW